VCLSLIHFYNRDSEISVRKNLVIEESINNILEFCNIRSTEMFPFEHYFHNDNNNLV